MKHNKIVLLFAMVVILVLATVALVACDDGEKTFSGVTFENVTIDYDGQEHAVTVSGNLPEGASVAYESNKGTNAGTYNAKATITCEGYTTLELTAKLTINKVNYDMTGIAWNYANAFTYDGTEKTVALTGTLPEGVTVSYTDNTKTNAGNYTAKATFVYDTVNHNAPTIADCDWVINKLSYDMTGIAWNYANAFTYDGTEKTVALTGTLPEGVTVSYTDNTKTNAGNYTAKATFSYDTVNHNAPTIADCDWVINKLSYDMMGIAWNYANAFTYDGTAKTVTLTGTLPDGVTVTYTDNTKTDAGSYTAKATFAYDTVNHNAPSIADCAWVINKADITATLTMSDLSVEYDSLPHSIQVVGNVPAGVTATYFYNNVEKDEVVDVGEYAVKCVLQGKNHNEKTLTATLKITSTEEQLFSAVTENGKIYFQNNLDSNRLYTVNGSSVTKISNDIPNYMIANGNELYFYSTSLFSSVIKNYNGTQVSSLYSANGEYLTTDGTYLYYAINNLLINTEVNGIYKVKLDGTDETATRLVADKAEYLTYCGNYIYYSNKSDGGKLYRVSVNATNAQGELLWDEKAEYIITDGSNLYFNSTKTVAGAVGYAAAIRKYVISSGNCIKLTTDAGKYLTKVGSFIYYINNDKITSKLYGDGIYKVSALTSSDSSAAGTKVLSAENNGYSSLASDGTNLYYYKLNDKHFYKNNTEGNAEVDLMRNFQVIEDTYLSGYSQVAEFKGEIYFTNPLDNGSLYKYNPTTKAKFKVLADNVSNVSFYSYGGKDYMYYSTYILTNYALFRMDLATNEITKVTSKRVENLIFEGDKIYCTRIAGAGANYLMQMDLDGSNEVELYKKTSLSAEGLAKVDDKFYFVLDPATFGYKNVSVYTKGGTDKTDLHRASAFVIVGDKIYFYAHTTDHNSSDNKEANALKVCNLDGSNTITVKKDVDITYMYAADGKVYFSSKSTQNSGLFVYDISNNKVTKISEKPAHGMTMLDGKLYFIQSEITYLSNNYYPTQNAACDGHLYCYDGTSVKKVA